MLMTSMPIHLPHSSVGEGPPGYDWIIEFDTGRVAVPEVTETVLVENVLVVTALVEPVTVGNVGREPLPLEVEDPTPLKSELVNDRVDALLPAGSELSDDRIDELNALEGGREPVDEPTETGSAELLGGGAPYVAIVTEVGEDDAGRVPVPLADDDEAVAPVEGGTDEPATLLELSPDGVKELEAEETSPDVGVDELAEFDVLDSCEDDDPGIVEPDREREDVTEFEPLLVTLLDALLSPFDELLGPLDELLGPFDALLGALERLLGPFDELLGPPVELLGPPAELLGTFDALLGPFELPYPDELDKPSEADAEAPEGLEVGTSEDPDVVLWTEETGTEAPDDAVEDEALFVDTVSEPDTEELTRAEEAVFGIVELEGVSLPEAEAEVTLLSKLDGELGSRLELIVTEPDAELPDAELSVANEDELRPGLVLRLGRVRDPEAEADPEVETAAVPLVAGSDGPLLTEIVGIVSVTELAVLLLAGPEDPGAMLELEPVAGGTDPEFELAGGTVADEGCSDDWDEDIPDIEDDGDPDEIPGDEDSPIEEDEGDPEGGSDGCPDDRELTAEPLEGAGPV
ncbi:hypothetical protein VM1G_07959 [Cytospora mali]|uniref:Uncharacterized protein n=1 Tax=Cytospora mali TaxID=578113 RepID=A0A194W653_CYTMA|nr:hypothetical protein VM1G_07959 [Valsa mali]